MKRNKEFGENLAEMGPHIFWALPAGERETMNEWKCRKSVHTLLNQQNSRYACKLMEIKKLKKKPVISLNIPIFYNNLLHQLKSTVAILQVNKLMKLFASSSTQQRSKILLQVGGAL